MSRCSNKKVKFAIVGAGRIGCRHAKYAIDYGELVAVCDIDKSKTDALAYQYHCHSFYSLKSMLQKQTDIDIVAICTPNGLHKKHTIQSLHSNCHVLCEKPMALSSHDCEQMIHVAETVNKRLFVVKQNRFNPPVEAVKKVIDDGILGRILSVHLNCCWNRNEQYYISSPWKGSKDMDGGTLFTQFSHFIDLLYWLVGDIIDVKVFLHNYLHKGIIDFEDSGVVILKFYNGAIGSIHYTVNSFDKNFEGSLLIFGEKGTVKLGGQYLNTLEYQHIKNYKIHGLQPSSPPNEYHSYVGSMSNHDKVYCNVVDVLFNNGSIKTDIIDGLKTVQIIEKIYHQSQEVVSPA